MQLQSSYTICNEMMFMTGLYDRNGKLFTIVKETDKVVIVDKAPLEIIAENIYSIGYDLAGAINSSKRHLGNIYHCPILVNPIQRIILFPTKSARHVESIWINPTHIKRTSSLYLKTSILFTNDDSLLIPVKLSSFNNKIARALQLEKLTRDTFYFLTHANLRWKYRSKGNSRTKRK